MVKAGLVALAVAGLVGGCGKSDDRQWMKVNERYTTEEFKRDFAECSKDGKLDETCMRGRGWVTVTSNKMELKNPFTERPRQGAPTGGRY